MRGALRIVTHSLVAAGASILAIAEMIGDKKPTAPDQIVPIGRTARLITSAIAVPRRTDGFLGAMLGGSTAVVACCPGWRAQMAVSDRREQFE